MGENDIIAEYIMTKYPNMLTTLEFSLFRLKVRLGESINKILQQEMNPVKMTNAEVIRKFDDEELARFIMYDIHEDFEESEKAVCGKGMHDVDDVLAWLRESVVEE